MRRFMGMMPSDEIKQSQTFKDSNNLNVRIDASPNGWTITFADSSTMYKDIEVTTEENFSEACKTAESKLGKLYRGTTEHRLDMIGEV